mgnify:CR=1 FL=1
MENELYHHGIKGQKWGVRRTKAQLGYKTGTDRKESGSSDVPSGSREAVKNYIAKRKAKKAIKTEAEVSNKKRSVSDMSDAELQSAINRKRLEQQYSQLYPKSESFISKFAKKTANEVIVPSATQAAKKFLDGYLDQQIKNVFREEDPTAKLKKEITDLSLKKQKAELDDFFDKRNDTSLNEIRKEVDRMKLAQEEAILYDFMAKRNAKYAGYLPAPK